MNGKFEKIVGGSESRWQRRLFGTLAVLAILCLLSSAALAQTGYSGLRGNITDASGAVVPGAKVVLTEPSTGTTVRSAITDAQGNYDFPDIKPGTYQINSEVKGFKAFVAKDVLLNAGVIRRLDIKLVVGGGSDSVEVTAGEAIINTEGGSISNSLDSQKIKDAPLIETYPSPYSMFATMPGVQGRDWGIRISGQDEAQLSIQVNGVSNDRNGDQNNNLRFVEEATVAAVNAPADSARVVSYNLTSKRGSNAWHGMVYYQHYNSVLNATPHPQPKKDPYIQHDWQAEIGGPIWKDHTFFYASWFQNKIPLGSYHTATVPTQAMWNGNMAGLGTAIDPITGLQFPNNIIPADRISAVATALQKYYPLPNIGDTNAYSASNFGWHHKWTSPLNYIGNWPFLRVDHNLTTKNTIFVSWMQRLTPFIGAGDLPSTPWTAWRNNGQLTVADTHTLSDRMVNTFRFGFSDDLIDQGLDLGGQKMPKGGDMITALGIQGVNPSGANTPGGPKFNIGNGFTGFNPNGKWTNPQKTFSFEDSFTWQAGRHLWKFGGSMAAFRSTSENASNYGTFKFNGMFTGVPFADFLLGLPSSSSRKDPC